MISDQTTLLLSHMEDLMHKKQAHMVADDIHNLRAQYVVGDVSTVDVAESLTELITGECFTLNMDALLDAIDREDD